MRSYARRRKYPRFSYRRRRRTQYARRKRARRYRRFRVGLRSRFVCHKLISVIDMFTVKPYFEIAPKLADFEQAIRLLDLYKRYRIKGINVRYHSDVHGSQLQLKDISGACVRLGCSPIAYEGEFTDCAETDCLRIKGFCTEFMVLRDFSVNRKSLVVNGATPMARLNPWLADLAIPHYGLYFKYCNLSPEYQGKVKRIGKFYVTSSIQFRDRKLATR
ncbi:uncharacterized protein DEA37_0003332 [Paragonimus westermani]|uniref:Capsid protein n=1 Tax=Paragonimus westermani TaxID=34504 RepID=A0A5J4NSA6_9TREM|nr:uncharacterized protein DEA37_0003332 [Paragonimus westermani]